MATWRSSLISWSQTYRLSLKAMIRIHRKLWKHCREQCRTVWVGYPLGLGWGLVKWFQWHGSSQGDAVRGVPRLLECPLPGEAVMEARGDTGPPGTALGVGNGGKSGLTGRSSSWHRYRLGLSRLIQALHSNTALNIRSDWLGLCCPGSWLCFWKIVSTFI